ncbi:unnamed protein product [Acanthosepion pharaonis]|uniref:C2H2-type domain-containing protein n=1 Tax=Acanthosepion pharaonis TaxID=158019 RepID=A0A812E7V3_ACAPH|nr:unnamed protein product [Sepia pharaonis]
MSRFFRLIFLIFERDLRRPKWRRVPCQRRSTTKCPGGGGAAGSDVGGVSSLLGRNRGDASEPGDVAERPGKSSLFFVKDRVRGIGSSGDTEKVPVERRGSGGVRCAFGGPGKSGSGFRSSRVGPYPPSAAGLQGVQPLVDGINVGKGSRQNGSVPSEEGLAPRTGSVGPCPCEARNRYGAVAFAPFALCGAGSKCRSGPRSRSCIWRWLISGRLSVRDASFTNSESTRSSLLTLVVFRSLLCPLSRFAPRVSHSLRVSARGATPSLPARRPASKTAPRPGLRGAPRLPAPLQVSGACRSQPAFARRRLARAPVPPVAQRLSAWGRSSGSERSTRNWYGPGESDCLIKTNDRVADSEKTASTSTHETWATKNSINFLADPEDLPHRCSFPVCPCAFTRASSLAAHIWKKHPAEWNDIKKRRDASRRSNVRTYARWTREELERMAAIEHEALSKGVQHMNSYLTLYLARTRDQISCRRKKDDYKAILKSLESEAQCPGPDGSRARVVPDSPRNDHPTKEGLVANGQLKRSKSSSRRHPMSRTPNWSLSFLAVRSRPSDPEGGVSSPKGPDRSGLRPRLRWTRSRSRPSPSRTSAP